jgi:two-component SAPR family response regulator
MVAVQAIESKIAIHTLGKFYVRDGRVIISDSSSRSKRMWEIFKFLLTYRDKAFNPEVILEKIWPENDYADPNLVMRAQIFRLRQALKTDPDVPSLAQNIVYSQGCYLWAENAAYWLDIDEFKVLITEAKTMMAGKPESAIESYQKAIAIYKGEYLPESAFSEWVEPERSLYHELFFESVFNLIDLLKAKRAYSEIIKVCEQAYAIDYLEEKIHIKMIEALLAEGQVVRARAHYNEVTSAFYREMGIKPSEQMKNLYRIVGAEAGSFELDLGTIQEGLRGKEAVNGAYLCDAELFRYFYKLERLRVERSGQSVLLGLLTLTKPDYANPDKETAKAVMQCLQDVILETLRKGDLVTRWNDSQFLLLLPGLNREQAAKVIERIENLYRKNHCLQGLVLHKKVESLIPLEGDAHFT